MLLVETILLHRQWSPAEWDRAYSDYPNRLVKVLVADRTQFVTSDAERRLDRPEGVQDAIDEAVAKVDGGRSFVRPSGTEDCVRVYAEAATREAADGASLLPSKARASGRASTDLLFFLLLPLPPLPRPPPQSLPTRLPASCTTSTARARSRRRSSRRARARARTPRP